MKRNKQGDTPLPILYVEWIDSLGRSGWRHESDLLEWCEAEMLLCKSIGFIFHEDDTSLTLVLSTHTSAVGAGTQVGDCVRIPKVAIKKRKRITL